MKQIIKILTLALLTFPVLAELPSWGMTENQYKLPNFNTKMAEIGKQAAKQNWQLQVTAPADWHNTIRSALTTMGERDVQMSFKDSRFKSIAISAAPGAKIAQISSSNSSNNVVQKQVVIDKPEINTEIEAPQFEKPEFNNSSDLLLEDIAEIDLGVPMKSSKPAKPQTTATATQPVATAPAEIAAKTPAENTKPPVTEAASVTPSSNLAQPMAEGVAAETKQEIEENKDFLRKRHARSKRVDKDLSYANITKKDELFIKGSVVLVKRFLNRGVTLFFWMKEPYDPVIHKLIDKGSGKYQKDPAAISGDTPEVDKAEEKVAFDPTNLDFDAVDDMIEDQDDLRREHIRNKRVDQTIAASQLKEGDILYVKNQTVLVERALSRAQSNYFWLVGDTTINREVEIKGDNQIVIK